MKRSHGFTLVELLVVIAIIAILAGIVIPNVPKFINKARATRAYAEIKGIDLAVTKMLTDAGRSDFRNGFFTGTLPVSTLTEQVEYYSTAFYVLLRKGKYADSDPEFQATGLGLDPEVKRKLGDNYMDLGKDPWGNLYHFYPGPFSHPDYNTPPPVRVPFRIFQPELDVPGTTVTADSMVRTVQDPDEPGIDMDVGWPAPRKQQIYVWSDGKNRRPNQEPYDGYYADPAEVGLDFVGGGDDINNWDKDTSWMTFYN